jgi:hypothetical protein
MPESAPTTTTDNPNNSAANPADDPRWRTRAAQAEDKLREVEGKLAASEASLTQSRHALDAAERRRTIERELLNADTVDLEAGTLLTEAAVAAMPKPDVPAAVADLRKRKPFLFRSGGNGTTRASAMSPAAAPTTIDLEDAASQARTAGDRHSLLRYLRLRRAH